KYRTPSFSTVVTGLLVAIPALFLNLKEVIDLSSIGTLFAFALVCGGVLVLENSKNPPAKPKFKTPYLNSRYILPLLYLAAVWIVFRYFKEDAHEFFSMEPRATEHGELEAGWVLFQHKLPTILFILAATVLALLSFLKSLSLIPVLGLL